MLKILVAPASYKGSIAAHRLADAMACGCKDLAGGYIHRLYGGIEIVEAPIADGGDDTLVSLKLAVGGELVESEVLGPTGQTVRAAYLRLPAMVSGLTAQTPGPAAKTPSGLAAETPSRLAAETPSGLTLEMAPQVAIIELAQASGIAYLTSNQLAPLDAHTYGTGQLIGRAITDGAKKIIVTIGGSASTDGGTGALSAIGAKFLDVNGQPVPRGGGGLLHIAQIDLSDLLLATSGVDFVVATDVTSPLLGELGAAAVFGPQKGASPSDVILLDEGLAHFAALLEKTLGFECIQTVSALSLVPGAGAAGGAGFGFAAILGAQIVSGFHFLADLLGLEQKIQWCDLIIVGEGRLDRQSVCGKGVGEIIRLAARLGKTVLALPACSELTSNELAVLVDAPDAGKIIVLATAESSGLATLGDVRAATSRALAQLA